MTHAIRPVDFDNLKTMTYEVTDRVARITFNRPEKGNAIVADTPLELSALVERLARVMEPSYIAVWLRRPVPALQERKPIDVIASGNYMQVAELVSALEEAPFT